MTKNSSGSWQSPQLRDVMSAPGNLLHWLDLSFWSSLYFISSWAAAWILIFSGDQFFVLSGFLIGFQAEPSPVHLVSWLWLPPRLQAETLTRNILQLRPMSKWNIPTMPITTKQDIFNETRFIFVTDITTSDLLQLECQPQVSQSREWSPLTPWPPHVPPILGRDGHFLTALTLPRETRLTVWLRLLWDTLRAAWCRARPRLCPATRHHYHLSTI